MAVPRALAILTSRAGIGAFSPASVGHDLDLACDLDPSTVGAVTLQLHMPAAVWAATFLLA